MNNEVYKSRSKVMQFIYELKNEGFKLPRIDVRIGTDKDCTILGKARLKDNIIWISQKTIDYKINELRSVVYHELLHAIYGCNHVKGCPIMSAEQPEVAVNKVKAIEIFKKYYNKYN
tara:strand:+ start:134 stop:484 length:351 start_codon:yes stop_codon:yes gene_type:complete